MRNKTGVLILAAGSSSRMGRPKQLLPYRGKPLLQHTLDLVSELLVCGSVLVLGASNEAISTVIDPGTTRIVVNPDWASGMASSLVYGLQKSLEYCPEMDQLLILLSDQPYINRSLLVKLLDTHHSERPLITASQYGQTNGVPALFSKLLFEELLGLEGDRGANRLIKKYSGQCVPVPFELGAVDIDTPEEYAGLLEQPDIYPYFEGHKH